MHPTFSLPPNSQAAEGTKRFLAGLAAQKGVHLPLSTPIAKLRHEAAVRNRMGWAAYCKKAASTLAALNRRYLLTFEGKPTGDVPGEYAAAVLEAAEEKLAAAIAAEELARLALKETPPGTAALAA